MANDTPYLCHGVSPLTAYSTFTFTFTDRLTDGLTADMMMPMADHSVVAVRSAKNPCLYYVGTRHWASHHQLVALATCLLRSHPSWLDFYYAFLLFDRWLYHRD